MVASFLLPLQTSVQQGGGRGGSRLPLDICFIMVALSSPVHFLMPLLQSVVISPCKIMSNTSLAFVRMCTLFYVCPKFGFCR